METILSYPRLLGPFPCIRCTCTDEETLPSHMSAKGGLFMPMYQRESLNQFAIKIYVGGVNTVSGEPSTENVATSLRRLNLKAEKTSIQDYVVTPQQLWLDGIASNDGRVRQFVAMPTGSGYSVEAQITREEVAGGLQFEITPKLLSVWKKVIPGPGSMTINIKTLPGKILSYTVNGPISVEGVKRLIEDAEGLPCDQQRFVFRGKQLEDVHNLDYYGFPDGGTILLILRLRGGGGPNAVDAEMGVAPGGLIKQCILEDKYSATSWDRARTITFNVQILNSEVFRQVTGMDPPETPIDARTYAGLGLPFYKIYNEQSSVKGNFAPIKSVKQMATSKGSNVSNGQRSSDDEPSYENPTVILNPEGQKMGFRPVSELEKELTELNYVQF